VNGRLLLAALAAVVTLAAGCSGSSSSVSAFTDTPPPSSTATMPPPPPAPGSQAELTAYLRRVIRPRLKGDKAIGRSNRAFENVDSTPDATWDKAAITARHTARLLRRIGDRMSAIVPPRPLTRAHLAYAGVWRADGLITADIASVLRQHGYVNWDVYTARFNRTTNSVIGYRVALIAYTAKQHLHLPRWVHTIGGK
jgi:hypothetical protein